VRLTHPSLQRALPNYSLSPFITGTSSVTIVPMVEERPHLPTLNLADHIPGPLALPQHVQEVADIAVILRSTEPEGDYRAGSTLHLGRVAWRPIVEIDTLPQTLFNVLASSSAS